MKFRSRDGAVTVWARGWRWSPSSRCAVSDSSRKSHTPWTGGTTRPADWNPAASRRTCYEDAAFSPWGQPNSHPDEAHSLREWLSVIGAIAVPVCNSPNECGRNPACEWARASIWCKSVTDPRLLAHAIECSPDELERACRCGSSLSSLHWLR